MSVYVSLWKGQPVSGRVVLVDEHGLEIATRYPWDNGIPEKIARENVARIVLVHHPVLPDPQKVISGATLIGGAAGATAGAISHTDRESGRWVLDGIAGAGLGFFVGCVAEAGFGTAALFHHDRVVYEGVYRNSGYSDANLRSGPGNSQIEDPR